MSNPDGTLTDAEKAVAEWWPTRYPGTTPTLADIAAVLANPSLHGYSAVAGKGPSPLELHLEKRREDITRFYGPGVWDALRKSISTRIGGLAKLTDEQQTPAELADLDSDIINFYLQPAIARDYAVRHEQFDAYARRNYFDVLGQNPQDTVTRTAIDGMLEKMGKEYETQHQEALAEGQAPGSAFMAEYFLRKAYSIMAEARPELDGSDPVLFSTRRILQEAALGIVVEARQQDRAAASFDRHVKELATRLEAVHLDFKVEAGVRAAAGRLREDLLSGVDLKRQFLDENRLAPVSIIDFANLNIDPLVGALTAGVAGYEGAYVAGDSLGSLGRIRAVPVEQEKVAKAEGDALQFAADVDYRLAALSDEELLGLGQVSSQELLTKAGGNVSIARRNIDTMIRVAKAKRKTAEDAAILEKKAARLGVLLQDYVREGVLPAGEHSQYTAAAMAEAARTGETVEQALERLLAPKVAEFRAKDAKVRLDADLQTRGAMPFPGETPEQFESRRKQTAQARVLQRTSGEPDADQRRQLAELGIGANGFVQGGVASDLKGLFQSGSGYQGLSPVGRAAADAAYERYAALYNQNPETRNNVGMSLGWLGPALKEGQEAHRAEESTQKRLAGIAEVAGGANPLLVKGVLAGETVTAAAPSEQEATRRNITEAAARYDEMNAPPPGPSAPETPEEEQRRLEQERRTRTARSVPVVR